MKLRFLGASDTVTGSRCLLESCGERILVDCGLFQGDQEVRKKNWDPFPIDPKSISAVVLTHAHIDHTGYLPRLVKQGYDGPVYTSKGTQELSEILLRDAAYLEEEQAAYANKTGYSSHRPAKPLFTQHDAESALKLISPCPRDEWIERPSGIRFRFIRSGHIIGSSFVQFALPKNSSHKESYEIISFSGDIGHNRSHTLRPPESLQRSDVLVLESTYGGRLHSTEDVKEQLQSVVNRVLSRNGVLVIPAFAVGRSQEILYLLASLEKEKKIPEVPVILDSPLAKAATKIFLRFPEDHILEFGNGSAASKLFPKKFECVESSDESMMVCMRQEPMIIISAAGMLTGGRILHHLKVRLPDPNNAVLFVGYQAEGSKGRFLQEKAKIEGKMRIHHKEVNVEAEVFTIDQLSSHADQKDLIEWLSKFNEKPKKIYLNHGTPTSMAALKHAIKKVFPNIEITLAFSQTT